MSFSYSHLKKRQRKEAEKKIIMRNCGRIYIIHFLTHCFTYSFLILSCVTSLCTRQVPRIVEIRDEPDGWLSKGAKTKDSNEYHTKQWIVNVLIEVQIKYCGPLGRRDCI